MHTHFRMYTPPGLYATPSHMVFLRIATVFSSRLSNCATFTLVARESIRNDNVRSNMAAMKAE